MQTQPADTPPQIVPVAGARSTYRLSCELWLPHPRERVFALFADAFQLERITPPWLNFKVLTPAPIDIAPGTLIDYRLQLRGLPVRWQSRISVWEPPFRFVDEQIKGPYRAWYHEHTFDEVDGGTLVKDQVDYSVPGGALVHSLFVKRDLLKIFAFRQQAIREIVDDK